MATVAGALGLWQTRQGQASEIRVQFMTDYAQRRVTMVDTQVRPSDVTKFPIIDAMLTVPRELFVPPAKREAAYMGEHVDLGDGRVVLDARTLAKMLDALDIDTNDLVLDIGPGLGYSTAVLAHLCEAVVAIEVDEDRVSDVEAALGEAGIDNAAVVASPLDAGAAKHGPYDAILLQGGVEVLPQTITDQLKDGGRIAAIFMEGSLGVCRIGHKVDGVLNWRPAFNALAPVLPGFEKAHEFEF
jgi:protein-L-isoaspartate(D-aspartate) O-methyltransferase